MISRKKYDVFQKFDEFSQSGETSSLIVIAATSSQMNLPNSLLLSIMVAKKGNVLPTAYHTYSPPRTTYCIPYVQPTAYRVPPTTYHLLCTICTAHRVLPTVYLTYTPLRTAYCTLCTAHHVPAKGGKEVYRWGWSVLRAYMFIQHCEVVCGSGQNCTGLQLISNNQEFLL